MIVRMMRKALKQDLGKPTSLKPQLPRPQKTLYIPRKHFAQLLDPNRRYTDELAPRYRRAGDESTTEGEVVIVRLLSDIGNGRFVIARLVRHPLAPAQFVLRH